MTDRPRPHDRRTPSGDAATDPFGRPIGRTEGATDPFGRPVPPARSTAVPVPVEPASPPITATPLPGANAGLPGSGEAAPAPTPPAAPRPLGVPAGFPRSAPEAMATPAGPPGSATLALVLGIGGVLFLPLLLSIPAWVVGARARRESRALPGRPGYGMATTGWLLGILGTIGWILIGLVMVLGVLALIGSSEIAYD